MLSLGHLANHAEGWGGELMRIESEYIALESVMIMLTVLAQTMFHPGFCFPALANTFGKKQNFEQTNLSRTEMNTLNPPRISV